VINVFSGALFSENKEAYAGFMTSNSDTFEIKRNHTRYDLSQPAKMNIPYVLDVENREILVLDFNNREGGYMAIHEANNIKKLIMAANTKNFISIEKLADMLSGEDDEVSLRIVENPKRENEISPEQIQKLFQK
jgi:hypothetical protein